jgi:hypothetical protein
LSGSLQSSSTLSERSLNGTLNALEYYRKLTHDRYAPDTSSLPLRNSACISKLVSKWKRHKPAQRERQEIAKATGSYRDTYGHEDRLTLHLQSLNSGKTEASWRTNARDRGMAALAQATFYRGQNVRSVELSDLGLQSVDDGQTGRKIEVRGSSFLVGFRLLTNNLSRLS